MVDCLLVHALLECQGRERGTWGSSSNLTTILPERLDCAILGFSRSPSLGGACMPCAPAQLAHCYSPLSGAQQRLNHHWLGIPPPTLSCHLRHVPHLSRVFCMLGGPDRGRMPTLVGLHPRRAPRGLGNGVSHVAGW